MLWAEAQPATPLVAEALGLAPGSTVHALQRLRGVDGDPLAIETRCYPADLTPGFLDRSLDRSLWELLGEHYGMNPARATDTFTLDGAAAQHLSVRAVAPGILLIRRTYDAAGRCIEFARDTYRADRAAFQFDAEILRKDDVADATPTGSGDTIAQAMTVGEPDRTRGDGRPRSLLGPDLAP